MPNPQNQKTVSFKALTPYDTHGNDKVNVGESAGNDSEASPP